MARSCRGGVAGIPGRVRLRAEPLEDRRCPAYVGLEGSTLVITGDAVGEAVVIEQNDSRLYNYGGLPLDTLKVTYTGSGSITRSYTSTAITAVEIDLGGGADTLQWYLRSNFVNYPFGDDKAISIRTGTGDDTVELHFESQYLNATVHNRLDIDVDTGANKDELYAYFGAVTGVLDFTATLGGSSDLARVGMMGTAYGHANVTVNGDAGGDDLWVGGGLNPDVLLPNDVQAGGSLTWVVNGGTGQDTLRSNYRGDLDGYFTLRMDGSTGDDTVEARLYLMGGSTGTLDAFLYGGDHDDHMDLRIYELAGSSVYLLQTELNGGAGYDRRHRFATPNVNVVSCEGLYPVVSLSPPVGPPVLAWV